MGNNDGFQQYSRNSTDRYLGQRRAKGGSPRGAKRQGQPQTQSQFQRQPQGQYQSQGQAQPQFQYQPQGRGRKPSGGKGKKEGKVVTIVLFLAILAFVGGGVWFWLNRTVRVSVNGTWTDVRIDSTLAEVAEAEEISTTPGDLVSVGGNVLEEGAGASFSATVNGSELDAEQIDAFRAKGNEQIVFGDGANVTEASHQEEREIQPKLVPYERIGAITFVSQYGKVGRQMFTIGDVSGESVAGDVVEPAQDVVIESINPQPEDGRKVIALTFDDGPSAYTQKYLDILSEYGAKATFFCLGSQVSGNDSLIQAIKNQGSQVASHTQNHEQLTTLESDGLQSEITEAFSAISSAGGGNTTVLRPPYGDFTAQTWLDSGGTLSASVIWNLDSCDWELPGVDAIVSNCTNGAWSGSIILMHDGGGNRDQDVEALPKILKKLSDEGYEFVTLNELMAMDSRIPESVASGNATIPEGYTWATEMAE